MAYAGAVWLAVLDDLCRNGIRTSPLPKSLQNAPESSPPEPGSEPGSEPGTETRTHFLERFDDHFLLQCFHFTRACLNFIVDYIRARVKDGEFKSDDDPATVEAQTLATLYFYAHGLLPKRITDMLGMEHAESSNAVNLVTKVLESMSADFITFPGSYDDRMGVAQGFKLISGIPSVVGLLCWLHVKVNPAPAEKEFFINALGYHSVMVQIICDVDGNLMNVEQCFPGATVEQQVWELSRIFQEFQKFQHEQTWILSRSLRKSKHVLTPVDGSQMKTSAATRFNTAHAQVLSITPHVLGSLKTRFQCLNNNLGSVKANALRSVSRIITSCCVLHNIAKKFSVPLPDELVLEPEHPLPVAGQQESFMDEMKEDMIEACFGNSWDEEMKENATHSRTDGKVYS